MISNYLIYSQSRSSSMAQPNNTFTIYQRFNDIICSHSQSEQELLSEILRLKKSTFLSQRVQEEMRGSPFYQGRSEKLEYLDYLIDGVMGQETENSGLLVSTQNAIFNEIVGIQLESYKIQKDITKQVQRRSKLEKELERLRKDPQLILNQQIKRQQNILLGENEFESIKTQLAEISIKIETLQLLGQDFEGKLQALQRLNAQLQSRKNILNQELSQWRTLLTQKSHYLEQQDYNRQQTQRIAIQQQANQQRKQSQEICSMLRERIELQSQITVQEAEKEQFIRLLINFKEKYTEVQLRNNHLKQELKRKGLHPTNESE